VPEEAHPRVPRLRLGEAALALDLDVLADDLDQILARVVQVEGRARELQAQRVAEEGPLEHLLADRDEDLDVVVDRVQVARRQSNAHLREVPVAAIDGRCSSVSVRSLARKSSKYSSILSMNMAIEL
jgi:hypothetical protein